MTSALMDKIAEVKYNPSAIQRVVLDALDAAMDGSLDIVDPTNPFVFLLEASAVSTATANRESMISLRKQHPQLAQVDSDLYAHMSDGDYLGRFSNPAYATFTFITQLDDLVNKGSLDLELNCNTLTIPKNTSVTVDGYYFTTQYPIDLRLHYAPVSEANLTGTVIQADKIPSAISVTYDTSEEFITPVQTLSDNNLRYRLVKHVDGLQYILFDVYMPQLSITSVETTINASSHNSYTLPFVDKYYTARAYTFLNGAWVELHTTHSDQVFDPLVATVLLKVTGQELEVTIPVSYIRSGLISSSLRVDVQTTKGSIYLNLANYNDDAFVREFNIIDQAKEYTPAVDGMVRSVCTAVSKELIVGGTDALDFMALRSQIITNSIGQGSIPITNAQIDTFVQSRGFSLIKNVDLVTNRIFLASRTLPPPVIEQLVTPANIGISAIIFRADIFTAVGDYQIDFNISDNQQRITILNDTLYYINQQGQLSFIDYLTEVELINDPVTLLNSGRYLYSPYYYALNMVNSEYEVSAYDLDRPSLSELSFLYQNITLMLTVNTTSYSIMKSANKKKADGMYTTYDLYIGYTSDTAYDQLPAAKKHFQLGFKPHGSDRIVYITAEDVNVDKKVVLFKIQTFMEIDDNGCLMVLAHAANESRPTMVPIDLDTGLTDSPLYMFYNTSSITRNYRRSKYDDMVNAAVHVPVPTQFANVTTESLRLTLGYVLKQLWTRIRTFGTPDYLRYQDDLPRLYETDVYASNPATGSIFTFTDTGLKLPMTDASGATMYDAMGEIIYEYNMPGTALSYQKLHSIGDPVMDYEGLPTYIHRVGDLVMVDGNVVTTTIDISVDMDVLLVDARYRYATDTNFVAYKKTIPEIISNWVMNDLKSMQDVLLEQTKIYFYAATSLSLISAMCDELPMQYIPAEQSFRVKLYVKNDVYTNLNIRTSIRTSTIKVIHGLIDGLEVKVADISSALSTAYGESVVSFDISKLGPSAEYSIIRVLSPHQRLCVKKILQVQDDRSTIVTDDIAMEFYLIK